MNTILLLFGGKSSEYEVSLSSATGAYQNIDRRKYNVLLCGITKKDGRFWLYEDDPAKIADGTWTDGRKAPLSVDLSDGSLSVDRDGVIEHLRPDAVLPMIHGKYCEDGTLQGLFAVAGIPVVGCDCQSSAVCMDKAVTKAIVAIETGLKTARGIVVKAENAGTPAEIDAVRRAAEEAFGYPMFVKPARAGSSVGVNKVKKPEDFAHALALAFAEDTKILVEEAVNGREIEVAVLEEHGRYTVAHPAEIDCGSSEFYDYETKFISDASSFYLPARISPEKQEEVSLLLPKKSENLLQSLHRLLRRSEAKWLSCSDFHRKHFLKLLRFQILRTPLIRFSEKPRKESMYLFRTLTPQ